MMLLASVCASAQQKEIQTIEELRKVADGTEIVLTIESVDTLYSTYDGRLCLSDGFMILTEGLSGAKGGMMLTGTLVGKKGTTGTYPLLTIDARQSKYEIMGDEAAWMIVDIDAYEQRMASTPMVTPDDEPQIPQDDVKGLLTVKGIKAFRQLAVGTEARLQFERDTVLFVGGRDAYVRGDAAICFRNMEIGLKEGMVLRGTVIGIRAEEDGMPLLLPSANTSDRYYIYDETSVYFDHFFNFGDSDNSGYLSDVVTVEDVVLDSLTDQSGARQLCVIGEKECVPVIDLYNVTKAPIQLPARYAKIKAVLARDGLSSLYFIPVQSLSHGGIPTAVTNKLVTGSDTQPLYDLQGRRCNSKFEISNYKKGVYIQNGRKVVR